MTRHIFRLTYFQNIQQFLQDGAVWAKNHQPIQACYRTSHPEIVSRRGTEFFAPCGTNINSFVPFYFSPLTGMFLSICYGRVQLVTPNNTNLGTANGNDIVFMVCNTNRLGQAGLDFWFTDIACNSSANEPTYLNDLGAIDNHVRWDLFNEHPIKGAISEINYAGACQWAQDRDDGRHNNRRALRMAEFMVRNELPFDLVDCIVVQNYDIKAQIETWIQASAFNIPVYVKPGCYY